MLTIGIDPVAFTIGSLEVRWYGIMISIGVLSLLLMMLIEAKRLGIKRDIYSIFFWGVIGGIVGGRLAYVIFYWEDFMANPRQIISFEGLAQNGMVIGIIVAALIYMLATKMRFATLLTFGDAFAVGAPLALGIGRIGCTLNGCCYGMPAPDLPWAVVYTHPNSIAPLGIPMHPTQIYHSLWNLIVFAIVWRLRGKFKPEGTLLFFCFSLYAVGNFGVRFLRAEEPVFWGLREAQIAELAILAVFLPWLIIRLRRFRKQAAAAELANEAESERSLQD
jgi:phosphatidylglycerol---prolipoprotein diacylglyceryl transferase